MGVYQATEPPAPTAALKWHEEAEKCRERIRRAISTGPGCTAVTHKPDQSVTGDPRWAEERAAMHCESPECPGHPQRDEAQVMSTACVWSPEGRGPAGMPR
jgi:hypothetical protein